ncbi:acyltransferase family protein [Sphingomonas kyungheensis]|uniref:Acyltransferase family protein n=1 Tax=Sphingomonas kyungheensis TaxID=1069987 RepID=A0ABU8H476_9SPHN
MRRHHRQVDPAAGAENRHYGIVPSGLDAMVREGFKPELQGLRAVAVLLVLVFHLDPAWLRGGYVGVDAFFVLSGYFITTSLIADIDRTGTIDLVGFYARRFRRLLPAAALVLAAMVIGVVVFPRDQWPHIAREVAAAALYVENLFLAHHSVDYLAFDRVASPVQHYWSLSVEEQFYLVWPMLLLGAVGCGRIVGWPVRVWYRAAIVIALLGSLALSILAGRHPQPGAYFYPQLRVWELALGGLIACLPARWARIASGTPAPVLQAAGLAMLVGASLVYSAKTVFPGSAALLPTIGAALVIVAVGEGGARRRNPLLDNRAMRWIGDLSYSIYLWHWPIIVAVRDHRAALRPIDAVGIVLLVLLLAQLTKTLVEDRFRLHGGARRAARPRWRAFVPVVVAIAIPLLLAAALLGYVAWDKRRFEAARLDPRDYPGAAALVASTPVPARAVFPAAHLVPEDLPVEYKTGCSLPFGESVIQACPSGQPDSRFRIAVVGDSHAAQWLPGIEAAGRARGWAIVPLTKSSCPLVPVRLRHFDAAACAAWSRNVMAELRAHPPQVVIYALYLDGEIAQLPSDAVRLAAVRPALAQLAALGSQVIVLRDTPHLAGDPIAALDAAQPRPLPAVARRAGPDIVAQAAATLPGVRVLDMNDLVCPAARCRAVIGNLVVWRDEHHIAAHYAATLGDAFAERLGRLIAADRATRR